MVKAHFLLLINNLALAVSHEETNKARADLMTFFDKHINGNYQQSDEYRNMLSEAVKTDGIDFCLNCLTEECAELVVAVNHLRRGRVTRDKVIEELADVVLMADMVRVGLDNEIGFYDCIRKKTEKIGKAVKFKKGT